VQIERSITDAMGAELKEGDTVLIPMYGNRLEHGTVLRFTIGGLCDINIRPNRPPIRRDPTHVVLVRKES
jgi:hypothetical protein